MNLSAHFKIILMMQNLKTKFDLCPYFDTDENIDFKDKFFHISVASSAFSPGRR